MGFWEELPDQCPPAKAADIEISDAYRCVTSDSPTKDDFLSQAARKRPLNPLADPCKHSSCSLFTCADKAKNIAYRLPKPREGGPFVAHLTIESGAGVSLEKNKHVDFWMYDTFDPVAAIKKIETV
jgi:hypothetical protein